MPAWLWAGQGGMDVAGPGKEQSPQEGHFSEVSTSVLTEGLGLAPDSSPAHPCLAHPL